MKVRVLMATLVITLLLGVQGFASPCDSRCVDPCGACDRQVARTGDLFSGLKRLVNGVRANNCDPCEPVVACNPCDDVVINGPCDDVCSVPRINLGGRLRNLFASQNCTPCDPNGNGCFTDCDPCGNIIDCDPCQPDNGCTTPRFRPFRNLFNGFRLNHGCSADNGPCDANGNGCFTDCNPCDPKGNGCFTDCTPCDPNGDGCGDTYCGPRGHLFELPRLNLGRLFGGLSRCGDNGICNPCDEVRPCKDVCCR